MKALILGTNAGQADIINYLKQNQWEVHACGYRREGPGCDLADKFHLVNIIDVAAVEALALSIQPDIIYSVSSDLAIKTVTTVSEKLGLPHFLNSEIVDLFDHKESFRRFLNENKISDVHFMTLSDLSNLKEWSTFPCVVKPSDSQGQRGVVLVDSAAQLKNAVKNAISKSNTNTAIIEEYLEGIEFSTNVIVQDYKVVVNEFSERYVYGKSYFGLPKGHGLPVRRVSDRDIEVARGMVETMVRKLAIKDAVLYIQMVATKRGPKIIEAAPRLDGCHIWRLIKTAKGYDLREYAIKNLLGKKIEHHSIDRGTYSLYFYQQPTGTIFEEKQYRNSQALVEYQEFRYHDGEKVLPINGQLEVVGYYIIKE